MEIANVAQKSLIGLGIPRFSFLLTVPLVYLRLQHIPLLKQALILRAQDPPDRRYPLPKSIRIDAGAGCNFVN